MQERPATDFDAPKLSKGSVGLWVSSFYCDPPRAIEGWSDSANNIFFVRDLLHIRIIFKDFKDVRLVMQGLPYRIQF